jgi:hypothetical protein
MVFSMGGGNVLLLCYLFNWGWNKEVIFLMNTHIKAALYTSLVILSAILFVFLSAYIATHVWAQQVFAGIVVTSIILLVYWIIFSMISKNDRYRH